MRVRKIRWYCKEDDMFSRSDQEVLSICHVISYDPTIDKLGRYVKLFTDMEVWFCYIFLDDTRIFTREAAEFFRVERRDVFEKHYLEWKAQNEG